MSLPKQKRRRRITLLEP